MGRIGKGTVAAMTPWQLSTEVGTLHSSNTDSRRKSILKGDRRKELCLLRIKEVFKSENLV